jgi:GLPGLI family protein
MKKLLFSFLLLGGCIANAQQYISKGKIEYEVRTNNHKIFGDGIWAEMAKEKMPNFSTTYYDLIFDGSKALYKFNRHDEKTKVQFFMNSNIEENIWYNDYDTKTFVDKKFVFDQTYLLSGALMNIDWKLSPNENREIAGFNCRKATGVIFDSVYVFAFYTEEIITSGGPMGINGLPGMIMGITIPRMFTSWIATKLQVDGVDTNVITVPTKGKKQEANQLKETVKKATSDWGTWGQQAIWNIFL